MEAECLVRQTSQNGIWHVSELGQTVTTKQLEEYLNSRTKIIANVHISETNLCEVKVGDFD